MAGKIVVGVDGSEGSLAALRWAWREARMRGSELEAVAAFDYPAFALLPGPEDPPVPHDVWQATARMVRDLIDVVQAEDGGAVTCRSRVEQGPAARVLLDASDDADMLVVGARGLGGFHRLLLGSVSARCAERAACPVVVVRPAVVAVA